MTDSPTARSDPAAQEHTALLDALRVVIANWTPPGGGALTQAAVGYLNVLSAFELCGKLITRALPFVQSGFGAAVTHQGITVHTGYTQFGAVQYGYTQFP
jgi:hypothetical protein